MKAKYCIQLYLFDDPIIRKSQCTLNVTKCILIRKTKGYTKHNNTVHILQDIQLCICDYLQKS